MNDFEYLPVLSGVEAMDLLAGIPDSRILAGGTDLLVLIKEGLLAPPALVNIKGLGELRRITSEEGGLRIGALVTLAMIEESGEVRQGYTALAQAASLAASPQLRNMATVGGNLLQRPRCWYFRGDYNCWLKGGDECYAVGGENHHHAILDSGPCVAVNPSDLAPALIALDASLEYQSYEPMRDVTTDHTIPVEQLFRNPTEDRRIEHNLQREELITGVTIPPQPEGLKSVYLKAMERQAWAFALVSVAARVAVTEGVVGDSRIVLGGVATTPWRATAAEGALAGKELNAGNIEEAARLAVEGAHPLDDNGYKVPLARNLVRRALNNLA